MMKRASGSRPSRSGVQSRATGTRGRTSRGSSKGGVGASHANALVARALSMGADHAEAFLIEADGTSARIDRDTVRAVFVSRESGVSVRVVKDGRVGFSYATLPCDARSLVRSALLSARNGRPGAAFPAPAKLPRVAGLYDARAARPNADKLCAVLSEMLDRAHAVHSDAKMPGGGVSIGTEHVVLANDSGVTVEERGSHASTSAYVVLRPRGEDPSTGSEYAASRTASFDASVAEVAASLARDSRKPEKAPTGKVPVLLTPEAAGELLELAVRAMRVEPLARGQSPFRAKVGEKVGSPNLRIYDDPALEGGLRAGAFDDDGLASAPHVLVEEGIRVSHLASAADAWRFGGLPSGSSLRLSGGERSFRAGPSAVGRCLRIESDRYSDAELFEEAADAVIVHDVIGAHTANPATGDFQVTSTLLFAIRSGQRQESLSPVVISGNVKGLLQGIRGIGSTEKDLFGSAGCGSVRIPHVLVDGFRLAG